MTKKLDLHKYGLINGGSSERPSHLNEIHFVVNVGEIIYCTFHRFEFLTQYCASKRNIGNNISL